MHPAVAEWFRRRFSGRPTEAQAAGWAHIAKGKDTLIAAPTGSGKTLAAFLVGIDLLYRAHESGEDVAATTRIVYVSPLKALATDVAENLTRPLSEIAEVACEIGLSPAPIGVGLRTGDTSASERAKMARRPPTFVVTTPESLYLLVGSDSGRRSMAKVETVIVDEIHAIAGNKRGSHLALTLERLEDLCQNHPQRIGLSATQRPIEAVGRLLVGARPMPAIVNIGHKRAMDLGLELPGGELEVVASASQFDDVLDRIAALAQERRTTLVFVNTRRLSERIAHLLGERLGTEKVAAHHGSLSRERRQRVEAELRAGALSVLVATASLELGIDVGPVELVCQVGSPRSISTLLQRVGRSNHSLEGVPVGRIFPLTRDELVECVSLLASVTRGELDAIVSPRPALDVAAQQLIAEVAAGPRTVEDLFSLLCRAAPFAEVSRASFDEVVSLVTKGVETGRGRRGAYLQLDSVNGILRPRRGARLAAATSGGSIPETGDFKVIAEPADLLVGTVNEDFALESMRGDVFLLGSHSWRILSVQAGEVRVSDAAGEAPNVPFWLGEAPARTMELSQAVSELRASIEEILSDGTKDKAISFLGNIPGVGTDAAETVVEYLAAGRAALGALPTQTKIVFERFFDESGGMQLVVHAPFGGRINRALGFALRKKFCRSFNFELQAAATDDAVLLSLGPHHSFPLDEVPRYVSSATLRPTLEQAILTSPLFQSRWRWTLNRALVVLRFKSGRRNPPAIQRMEADDLLAAVFPQAAACQENVSGPIEIPEHLLVRQSIEDTLHEALDIDGFEQLLRGLEEGSVGAHCIDTTEPSVLAHEIVTARPYAFLDDEELQNRRTNAVSLRRGLEVDLSSIGKLDEAAIRRVEAEILPDPKDADELADLLELRVLMRPQPQWEALFSKLAETSRAEVVIGNASVMWSSAETAELVQSALAGEDAALRQLLRGHLETGGILSARDLAEAVGLTELQVEVALLGLETEGFALRGHYRDQAGEEQWVARRILARMHSYSRRNRRSGTEPASRQDFMRFLLRWQHVAPGTQLRGSDGLFAVLDQLQGYEAAAAIWEPQLLKKRLADYSPTWLDSLCHSGEVAWCRLSPRPGNGHQSAWGPSKATPIAVVMREDLPWLLAATRADGEPGPDASPATAEVVEVLGRRGASFSKDIEHATGRLGEDVARALWDGVARGLLMCDGFGAIRSRLAPRHTRALPSARRFRQRRNPGVAGRWSLVPAPDRSQGKEELAERLALQLLARWGVLVRDLVATEKFGLPWRELQWALRRLEDRGIIRGGHFVAGFSGEQFALPEAVQELTSTQKRPKDGKAVTISAADPLNLVGRVVAGESVPALHTRTVTFIDGLPATSPSPAAAGVPAAP